MRASIVLVSLLVASTALAQDAGLPDGGDTDAGLTDGGLTDGGMTDAGAPDAGPVDCTPRCEGDTLLFCDDEEIMTLVMLDCVAELDATCGELSDSWGDDCLLPQGAACTPGYADGASRCAGDACCVAEVAGDDGVCTAQPAGTDCSEFAAPAPPRPGLVGVEDTDEELASCLGVNCANFPGLSLLPVFVALRLRRRRRS